VLGAKYATSAAPLITENDRKNTLSTKRACVDITHAAIICNDIGNKSGLRYTERSSDLSSDRSRVRPWARKSEKVHLSKGAFYTASERVCLRCIRPSEMLGIYK